MLLIYLKSSSGKIPAGNVTIDVNSLKKGLNKVEANVMKCPDKSASISYSVELQVEKEIDLQQKDETIGFDTKSRSSFRDSFESPRSLQDANKITTYSSK